MAAHSSVLAWRIPGTGEPGGLPSLGSHRVRHDWSGLAVAAAAAARATDGTQSSPWIPLIPYKKMRQKHRGHSLHCPFPHKLHLIPPKSWWCHFGNIFSQFWIWFLHLVFDNPPLGLLIMFPKERLSKRLKKNWCLFPGFTDDFKNDNYSSIFSFDSVLKSSSSN